VTRKTDPHGCDSSRNPATIGPQAAIAPPVADHRAIDRVRQAPDHRAAIRASVVGPAFPAENPPTIRARTRT
jgi:hypothetical protein